MLSAKYFDKLDNQIANFNFLNKSAELMVYQNNHLVSMINMENRDTFSIYKFLYSGQTSIGHKYYTKDKNRNELYLIQYLDSLCQKKTETKWYIFPDGDTSLLGTWINEYDSIGQKIKSYVKEDSEKKYTFLGIKSIIH